MERWHAAQLMLSSVISTANKVLLIRLFISFAPAVLLLQYGCCNPLSIPSPTNMEDAMSKMKLQSIPDNGTESCLLMPYVQLIRRRGCKSTIYENSCCTGYCKSIIIVNVDQRCTVCRPKEWSYVNVTMSCSTGKTASNNFEKNVTVVKVNSCHCAKVSCESRVKLGQS